MSSIPFFSIVIPTYNRPEMLSRAVDSIFSYHTHRRDFEIVVVNDGSSVSYNEFKHRTKDNLIYYENNLRKGVAAARNIGVSMAKGQWILFLDDDDELVPSYLDEIKNAIHSRENCPAFWGGVKIIQRINNCLRAEERIFYDNYGEEKYLIHDLLTIGVGFGFVIKKSVFNDIGMFDETLDVCEDTELFIRMVSNNLIPSPIPKLGVIKHEEHNQRLSADLEIYSRNNTYIHILEKHRNSFLKKSRYNYIHLLMWSYRLHRQYGHQDLGRRDLNELVQLGIPREHVEECYLSHSNLSEEYME